MKAEIFTPQNKQEKYEMLKASNDRIESELKLDRDLQKEKARAKSLKQEHLNNSPAGKLLSNFLKGIQKVHFKKL